MKLFEFLNNRNNIQIVKRFIFFDNVWSFPDSESSDLYIISLIGKENIEEYKNTSKIIVDKLNSESIDPNDFENSFSKIIKGLWV